LKLYRNDYLMHFNRNHDPRTGRFTGDGVYGYSKPEPQKKDHKIAKGALIGAYTAGIAALGAVYGSVYGKAPITLLEHWATIGSGALVGALSVWGYKKVTNRGE